MNNFDTYCDVCGKKIRVTNYIKGANFCSKECRLIAEHEREYLKNVDTSDEKFNQ